MSQTAHHYLVFETAGGFCGIAWSEAGITRFQLPTTTAEATERLVLRRLPGAEPGGLRARWPRPSPPCSAISRVRRRFLRFELDLGEQDEFFRQVYAAARQVGWGRTTTYGALAKELGAGPEAARDVGQAMAQQSGCADHPLPSRAGGRRQDRRLLRTGRLDRQDAHAGAGRHPPRAATIVAGVVRVLRKDGGYVATLRLPLHRMPACDAKRGEEDASAA